LAREKYETAAVLQREYGMKVNKKCSVPGAVRQRCVVYLEAVPEQNVPVRDADTG